MASYNPCRDEVPESVQPDSHEAFLDGYSRLQARTSDAHARIEASLRAVGAAGSEARKGWLLKDASPSMPLDAIYGRVTIGWRAIESLPAGPQSAGDVAILAMAALGDVTRILREAGYTL